MIKVLIHKFSLSSKKELISTSVLSLLRTVIHIFSLLFTTKLLAIYVGPGGLGLYGQLQGFANMLVSLIATPANTALTKYTAEYSDNPEQQKLSWSVGFKICFPLVVISSLILFFSANQISFYLVGANTLENSLKILSVALPLMTLNIILLAILNGLKKVHAYIMANCLGSIGSAILIALATYYWGLAGALNTVSATWLISCVFTIYYVKREKLFDFKLYYLPFQKVWFKRLLSYSLMPIVTVLLNQMVLLYIRTHLAEQLSWDHVGYWQGVWKISETYNRVITMTISLYYLPKLSSCKNDAELRAEILSTLKFLVPLIFFSVFLIYCFRYVIIKVVLTEDFLPMADLFAWQCLGDFFKNTSWLIAHVMLARAMISHFVITEIIFCSLMALFSYFFINQFGMMGTVYSYCLLYFLYLGAMIFLFRKLLFTRRSLI